jgi:aromatase
MPYIQWQYLVLNGKGQVNTHRSVTHDFAARPTEAIPSAEKATELLRAAVERNSHADLDAVRKEAERRAQTVGSTV